MESRPLVPVSFFESSLLSIVVIASTYRFLPLCLKFIPAASSSRTVPLEVEPFIETITSSPTVVIALIEPAVQRRVSFTPKLVIMLLPVLDANKYTSP